jgi:hypothetical protein
VAGALTDGAIRRLARRGGVMRIRGWFLQQRWTD